MPGHVANNQEMSALTGREKVREIAGHFGRW
jgi:hypothetical protein